ncbi:MAG: TAT-variant-translocated molybdopterin oxidoreductase [Phycisphaerales bacterium]|nr:TAT-variant-translocated molybdopterin oxidoreductase [Phycisphaerales bacterium]
MPSLDRTDNRRYWRSLDDLADTPEFREFVEKEFPNFAPELLTSPTRRRFLKLMGASLGLAGLAGCRWPRETILPHGRQPAGLTPGVPVYFATGFDWSGVGIGALVTSYDGRPIKVEGNREHPASLGAATPWMQLAILDIYDPERQNSVIHRGAGAVPAAVSAKSDAHAHGAPGVALTYPHNGHPSTWEDFDAFAKAKFAELRSRQGAGLTILCEQSSSPTLADLQTRLQKAMPQAKWHEYEPISNDNEMQGLFAAYGKSVRPIYAIDKADVVVCLDADPLMHHPASITNMRQYAARRRADDGTMVRLHAIESTMSLTGSNADHRHPVRSSEVGAVAITLAAAIAKHGVALPAGLSGAIGNAEAGKYAFVEKIAEELAAAKGKSLILAGPRQPAAVHTLVAALNAALGAVGTTVQYASAPQRPAHLDAIRACVEQLNAGGVDTLLIIGGNPAYDAPADLNFAAAIGKAANTIHLSNRDDETSVLCKWSLPRAHWLETWGDIRAADGSYTVCQPLIEALYGGRSAIEMVAMLLDEKAATGHELVRRTFSEQIAGKPEWQADWERSLHDGIHKGSGSKLESPTLGNPNWTSLAELAQAGGAASKASGGAMDAEIVFVPDNKIYDGRFANNGWMQELPDPITKLTWDNAAWMSPADAKELGVEKYGDNIEISANGKTLKIPAFPVPGHAVGSVSVSLGYGRIEAGTIARGAGFDVYPLRTSSSMSWVRGSVKRVAGTYSLATTQDHHAVESKVGDEEKHRRIPELYREGTLGEFKEHPNFAAHRVHSLPLLQLFGDFEFGGFRWGMTIDLSACTGCSACVIACQAENNIPVVGKAEVARGREMHWIRIDRYWVGDPASATVEVAHHPVTCQQCENAPCEQVCPVGATTHDEEGINVMVYNRCVGTRYCSNNCPYKVRRFNYFYNHHGLKHPRGRTDLTDIQKMGMNPDVTVRSRGVMEKCTFCVQRLNLAKIEHKNAQVNGKPVGKFIADEKLITACAQACPAEAIVFGDLADPNSRVAKLTRHDRAYSLLEELNTRPRLRYLAKLRNPVGGGHGHAPSGGHATDSHG